MKIIVMVASAIICYLLGSISSSILVGRMFGLSDIRKHGSGNAGLTNFHRIFGGPLTFVVILTDMLKAVVAVLLSVAVFRLIGAEQFLVESKYWAALFCLLGHMFPCMFHFKGGKGILSGGTIALMVDWRIALVVWGGFIVLVALTRYVSLGSVWAGSSFPFITWYCFPEPVIVVLGFLCGGLVVYMHRANIKRLIQGNESKFSFHKKKS